MWDFTVFVLVYTAEGAELWERTIKFLLWFRIWIRSVWIISHIHNFKDSYKNIDQHYEQAVDTMLFPCKVIVKVDAPKYLDKSHFTTGRLIFISICTFTLLTIPYHPNDRIPNMMNFKLLQLGKFSSWVRVGSPRWQLMLTAQGVGVACLITIEILDIFFAFCMRQRNSNKN